MTNFLPPSYSLTHFKIYLKLTRLFQPFADLVEQQDICTCQIYQVMIGFKEQHEPNFFILSSQYLHTESCQLCLIGILSSWPRASFCIFRLQKVCGGQTFLPPIQKINAICQVSQSQARIRKQELYRPQQGIFNACSGIKRDSWELQEDFPTLIYSKVIMMESL